MKVLSLFDGMACGMLAMLEAGVSVDRYVAYEIDKFAVRTSSHNFPMIEQRGDVFQADFTEFAGFDWLVGGSPCTYWSIAQTKNRETVASGMGWELFSQYVRALHEAKPKYFIYENNKSMSKQIRASIDKAFGFEAVLINSALVSAQNRQRLYWVGKRNEDGSYSKVNVEQPADRGILLKDVLDNAVAMREKAHAVIASAGRTTEREFFTKNQGNMAAEPVAVNLQVLGRKRNSNGEFERCYEARTDSKASTITSVEGRRMVAEPINVTADGKAQCLRATCYKDGIRNIIANEVDKKTGVAEPINDIRCANGDGAGAKTGLYAIPYAIEFDDDGRPIKAIGKDSKEITIYEVRDGKIAIKGKQYPIKLKDGYYIIRKLTVSECKRLQTVPEWYEFPVSDSQAYKMLGNGWTVDVIAHILKGLKEAKEDGRYENWID